MSEAKRLAKHYAEVHKRLRNPPNAVPDTGINLVRKDTTPPKQRKVLPQQKPSLADHPLYVPLRRTDLTFSSTLRMTAKEFDLTPKEILHRCRQSKYSFPRQVAIYLAYKHGIHTLVGMGRHLGLDHSSVLHGRNKIAQLIEEDASLRERIASLEERLLAAYPRPSVSAVSKPHLDPKKATGDAKVRQVPTMDSGG